MDLTDAQWAILEPVFRPKRRSDWRGRPWRDTRSVLNGVLWILRTGAQWRELPSKYPPYQTCHRRFQSWQRSGLLIRVLQKLAEALRDRGRIDLSETFIDASFSSATKGALLSAGSCCATATVGKSNGCLLGCITSAASSRAGNIRRPTSSACSNSAASSSS